MTLVPLPALADNYLWMLHDGFRAIEADPGVEKPASDALARSALQLPAILVTPRHANRTGGLADGPLFLRSREATDIAAVRPHAGRSAPADPADVFTALRPRKNDSR